MPTRAHASLLLTGLALIGLTRTAVAQTEYRPVQVGKQPAKAKAKAAKLITWSAKPGSQAQLDPELPLFGWSIRPPRGFVYTQKFDNHNQLYIFQGHTRADNTAPSMWIILGDVKNGKIHKPTEEEVLDLFMLQLHQNRDNWKVAPYQVGSIRGRRFIRRRWSATEPVDGATHHLRGTVYLTVVGATFAAVTLQAIEPGAGSDLALMETSALSFHKR